MLLGTDFIYLKHIFIFIAFRLVGTFFHTSQLHVKLYQLLYISHKIKFKN